jgi:hypothetical protein
MRLGHRTWLHVTQPHNRKRETLQVSFPQEMKTFAAHSFRNQMILTRHARAFRIVCNRVVRSPFRAEERKPISGSRQTVTPLRFLPAGRGPAVPASAANE